MSLEAASLRDRACQGAPATRAKRGEYDPKYHCCMFLSPCFGAGGFAATPSPCSHIRVVSTVGTSPLPCASSQDTQFWGEAKSPSRWPGQLSPCQLPARSGYKHSSFFYSLSACCLHTEMLNETFCRRSQSTQLPRGQEHPLDQSVQDGAAGTKRGLHENKAGREEKSSCKRCTRLTRRNLPHGTSCLLG